MQMVCQTIIEHGIILDKITVCQINKERNKTKRKKKRKEIRRKKERTKEKKKK